MPEIASDLSARDLLDRARIELRVESLYALADLLNISPGYVQRYYRKNSLPTTVRALIIRVIEDG